MKKAITTMVLLSAMAFNTNAAFITNDNILDLDIRPTSGWSIENPESLFDGITSRSKNEKRFAAYRGSGTGPLDIGYNTSYGFLVTLDGQYDINSFSIYNDWGNNFEQSVTDLYVDFWREDTNDVNDVLAWGYYSIEQGTWDVIDLNITPVDNVGYMRISVLGTNTTGNHNEHFEIREFQIGATPTAVNSPATLGLMSLAGLGLLWSRKRRTAFANSI